MSPPPSNPYSERDEWKDVVPLPQDDGTGGVVSIAYGRNHRELIEYLHAVVASGEVSSRVFRLTSDILPFNYANYTAWRVRRKCLFDLGMDVKVELQQLESTTLENHKNYQIWWHRRECLKRLDDCDLRNELVFICKVFTVDSKNYHAWEHRQWVVKELRAWDEELAFTATMIGEDPRNNSAWSQRYWAANRGCAPNKRGAPLLTDTSLLDSELNFAESVIQSVPHSESPWNYLRGVAQVGWGRRTMDALLRERIVCSLWTFCSKVLHSVPDCRHCQAMMGDILMDGPPRDGNFTSPSTGQRGDALEAAKLYRDLRASDSMRANYWHIRECQALTMANPVQSRQDEMDPKAG